MHSCGMSFVSVLVKERLVNLKGKRAVKKSFFHCLFQSFNFVEETVFYFVEETVFCSYDTGILAHLLKVSLTFELITI